jgi:hypothetical protein
VGPAVVGPAERLASAVGTLTALILAPIGE